MMMAIIAVSVLVAAASIFGWQTARTDAVRARMSLAAAQEAVARLAILEAQLTTLRHDLRGILSPAMLVSDRLLEHEDPAVRKAGERVVRTVERAAAKLAETKFSSETIVLR